VLLEAVLVIPPLDLMIQQRNSVSLQGTEHTATPRASSQPTAASILAGESSFGSESMEMTDTKMDSTPRIGRHRSSAVSCWFSWSSPGGCRIEMHTTPFGYTAAAVIIVSMLQ